MTSPLPLVGCWHQWLLRVRLAHVLASGPHDQRPTDQQHRDANHGTEATLRADTTPKIRSSPRFGLDGVSGQVEKASWPAPGSNRYPLMDDPQEISLVVTTRTARPFTFHSREGRERPQLVIWTRPAPETLGSDGIQGGCLVRYS